MKEHAIITRCRQQVAERIAEAASEGRDFARAVINTDAGFIEIEITPLDCSVVVWSQAEHPTFEANITAAMPHWEDIAEPYEETDGEEELFTRWKRQREEALMGC